MKLLMIRLDRIGDLVMTLPVDQSVNAQVRWWIPPGLRFITDHANPKRDALEVPKKIDFAKFRELLKAVRAEKFDGAIVFNGPWWVSALLWCARVQLRAGVKSKWHSFLFLNRAIRQKRSRSEFSELEYNFQLLEAALDLPAASLKRESLRLKCNDQKTPSREGLEPHTYTVVHPGMAGSALNWPLEHYTELIRRLTTQQRVVITGTAADEPYLAPIRTALQDNKMVTWLDKKLSGPELISVLENAKAIVAPSTGVLHLAASTGRPTLGLFSPVRVQRPRRWGPQGPRATTLMAPHEDCPGELSCLGKACPYFDCMYEIQVADVLAALNESPSL